MSILEVSGLYSGYGQIGVLRDISFSIEKGEILGILGHNGMGKSTLLKTISGDLRANAGRILFEGQAIETLPTHKRALAGIGYVPQGRQIFSNLTVFENMMMAALGARKDPGIVADMIAKFPRLVPITDRKGGVLSGGEQQILALARCLCGQPKLVLLDEPTEGVQPSIRDEIVETLLRLREEFALTILLVEQNVKFMGDLVDRVLHMEKGELLAAAPVDPMGLAAGSEGIAAVLH